MPVPVTDPRLEQYKPMVRAMAAKAHRYGLRFWHDYEDVVSIGMEALWEATQRFNPEFGAKFSTYARLCIDSHFINAKKSLKRAKRRGVFSEVSLDLTYPSGDQVFDPPHQDPSPEGLLLERERHRHVREGVERLSERDRYVLLQRVEGQRSLTEVGRDLKVTRQAAHQIERGALLRLRAMLLWDYTDIDQKQGKGCISAGYQGTMKGKVARVMRSA